METAVSKCRRVKTNVCVSMGKQEPGDGKRTRLQHLVCSGSLSRKYTLPAIMCISLLASIFSLLLTYSFCLFADFKMPQKAQRIKPLCFYSFSGTGGLTPWPVLLGNHVAGGLVCDMNSPSANLQSRPLYVFATFKEKSHFLPQ